MSEIDENGHRSLLSSFPEILRIRPSMRQRLWNEAMQAARLDNAGSAAARAWFVELCQMMVAQPIGEGNQWKPMQELVQEFIEERLEPMPCGSVRSAHIYTALQDWWKKRGLESPVPSIHRVSRVLQGKYELDRKARHGTHLGCRLKEDLD